MSRDAVRRHDLAQVTILFMGDSGDGVQLTGTQFANTSAAFGNDVSTLPDFPAEIRAPAGSLAGVSSFQLHFANTEVHTPGDKPDVLVAMNPAALKVGLPRLRDHGLLVVNSDAFTAGNLRKAGYGSNPLHSSGLAHRYQLHDVPITTLTTGALQDIDLNHHAKDRCKNFFTLGLLFWMYDQPIAPTLDWIQDKFAGSPTVAEANRRALRSGYHYGETTEAFAGGYHVSPAKVRPGTYRIVNGNEALALGFVTAARLANKPLVYSSYPITPASDVLHHLARFKHLDVRPLQVEDEIAAIGASIGASFGGALALTGTSGPGICLKSEGINLAVALELPLVVLNVQRGGPSTGLPTKTEQADLLQAMFGRNGESPVPILAPQSPSDCFNTAIDAFRIAVRYMTPVFILSDGYIANGAEPWRIPAFANLEPIEVHHADNPVDFQPYARNPSTLSRPWVLPGTPGMSHRIGGLEKEDNTGNVSYDPQNHERMCRLRAEKVRRIGSFLPPLRIDGPPQGKILVVSWGGTYGAVTAAVQRFRHRGASIAHIHLKHLNPFPPNLGSILTQYEKVLVPELNSGQLALMLRARFLIDAITISKLQAQPFTAADIETRIEEVMA